MITCCVRCNLQNRAVASILRFGVLNKAVPSRIEAPKAPRGVGCGEGVSPSPQGECFGETAVPLPQKIFDILESKWLIFVDSLVRNCAFLYDQNSKKIHPKCMECHGD